MMSGASSFPFALLASAAMTLVLHGCGGDETQAPACPTCPTLSPTPAPTLSPTPAPSPAPACPTLAPSPAAAQPVEALAEQLCDNGCVVEIKCDTDGGCIRVPNDKCLRKEPARCFHHETCHAFRDESLEQRTCDKMTACCAFNSRLIVADPADKVIDPMCGLATEKTGSGFCKAVDFSSELLAERLCDNGCVVQIKCDKDGGCIRVPNDKCLRTEPADCFHHETCQEFKNETFEKKECDTMTACCGFNSRLIVADPADKVIDPICDLATAKTGSTFCPATTAMALV